MDSLSDFLSFGEAAAMHGWAIATDEVGERRSEARPAAPRRERRLRDVSVG